MAGSVEKCSTQNAELAVVTMSSIEQSDLSVANADAIELDDASPEEIQACQNDQEQTQAQPPPPKRSRTSHPTIARQTRELASKCRTFLLPTSCIVLIGLVIVAIVIVLSRSQLASSRQGSEASLTKKICMCPCVDQGDEQTGEMER